MATTTALLATFLGNAAAMALAPGAKVVVVGNGPIQCLAARLAAIGGYETTLCVVGSTRENDEAVVFDESYPEGSIPLKIMPVTGEGTDVKAIEDCVAESEGLIVAFDDERTMPEQSMNVFMPADSSKLSHVTVMSRYLNGAGMGFTASAAKVAANGEIWAGGPRIEEYKKMEGFMKKRADDIGAGLTVIRAGTLKGGGCGDKASEEGGGEPTFLNKFFYTLGQQDIVNWRLLYDMKALGVELSAGDTLPGPGFMAALTATDNVGQGDSHRGAVAMALVQALGVDATKGRDYSVKATESREFPKPDAWPAMFEKA